MPVNYHEAKASRNDPIKRIRRPNTFDCFASLAMTQDYHFALFFVIASEHSERGKQQAKNPRIMKDSMPFDCFASLATTDSSILLCPKSLQVAIETIPPSPPDNAASRFAMAMGQRA